MSIYSFYCYCKLDILISNCDFYLFIINVEEGYRYLHVDIYQVIL